jgi:hypothetical protein
VQNNGCQPCIECRVRVIYIYHDNHISTIRKGITTNNEGDNRILLDRLLPSISHDNLEAKQGLMICHDFLLIGFHSSTTPLNHNLIKLRLWRIFSNWPSCWHGLGESISCLIVSGNKSDIKQTLRHSFSYKVVIHLNKFHSCMECRICW